MVRFGLVGAGHMNHTYARCLLQYNEGARLLAVAGGSRVPEFAAEYGIDAEPDVGSLLSRGDIDAVIIAAPHQVLAEHSIAAAGKGKHVLVENPMATNLADCDAMIDASRRAGCRLGVIKSLRYRGVFSRAHGILESGSLGAVRVIHFLALWPLLGVTGQRWLQEPAAGGAFLARGAHMFDMLFWLTGQDAESVTGSVGSYHGPEWRAQSALAQVRFSDGAGAQIWMSHEIPSPGFPHSRYRARIWCENGLLDCDGFGKLRLAAGAGWEEVWEQPPIWNYAQRKQNLYSPQRMVAYHTQVQDFIDAVRNHRDPAVTGEDGRAAVEMVEATRLSSETGTSIRLPLGSAATDSRHSGTQ